jgi:O-antigen ligase
VLVSGAVAAIGAAPLTAPIRASGNAALAAAIRHTGSELLLLAVGGCLAGLGYALADRRLHVPQHVRATAGSAARIAVVLLAVAVLGVVVARNPARLWSQFESQPQTASGSTHLFTLGSNRSDFWRVALTEFVHHPLGGIGARGFATAYLQHRRSPESPARAHSLEADALSETGLVGFGLLAGSLGLLLLAAVRRARFEPAGAGALGGAVCVLAQASVDWTWTFPAVGLPLFLLLGAGASAGRRRSARLSLATAIGVSAAVAVLGLVAFAPPWLAARYDDRALQAGPDALADVRRAKQLDPLSVDPLITESQLAPNARAALVPLRAAVRKEPQSYAMHYLLAFGYYRAGLNGFARRELLAAHRLDPGDPIVSFGPGKADEKALKSRQNICSSDFRARGGHLTLSE